MIRAFSGFSPVDFSLGKKQKQRPVPAHLYSATVFSSSERHGSPQKLSVKATVSTQTFQGYFFSNLTTPSQHVKAKPAIHFGKRLRFGQRPKLPEKPQYQDYSPRPGFEHMKTIRVAEGDPEVLGATVLHKDYNPNQLAGVNVALFSKNAEQVELCLFENADSQQEAYRIPLKKTGDVWHGFSPDIKAGQVYGFRAKGVYEPTQGKRFNEYKMLLDPYAKAIARTEKDWDPALSGYQEFKSPNDRNAKSNLDSAHCAPLAAVVDDQFDWNKDSQLKHPWENKIIYEAHVKGMTALHPLIPKHKRGTYAGLTEKPVLDHLKKLGVTSVELLPVHHFRNDQRHKGKSNYWGYNTLNFFAPHPEYASNQTTPQATVDEFKNMVKTLHDNGMEVILDVVYNHTAEGNENGPTLSMRGTDNESFYRLVNGQRQYYMDYTGCGNTLDTTNPKTIDLIKDSLRYWVEEMHVDGFRFDLASALGRNEHGWVPGNMLDHPLFKAIHDDPVLSKVDLIAEPWDASAGGYRVGGFPNHWRDWNGLFRDDMRTFWRGDYAKLPAFASRLSGSHDIYSPSGKSPLNGINFITAHDGFTMQDLVSYSHKHNEANGENNQDGENDNHSLNYGVEGPTDNPAILAKRKRHIKNLWATLMLSSGVPMILHGDEIGRTQKGNNNVYCQDNDTAWMNWNQKDSDILEFAQQVTQLRKQHPVFRRTQFLNQQCAPNRCKDVSWYHAGGQEMQDKDWNLPFAQSVGVVFDGDALGKPGKDDHFLLLANASNTKVNFSLPPYAQANQPWQMEFDTARKSGTTIPSWQPGQRYPLEPGSFVLLKKPNPQPEKATQKHPEDGTEQRKHQRLEADNA